jgi:hypothetical protein
VSEEWSATGSVRTVGVVLSEVAAHPHGERLAAMAISFMERLHREGRIRFDRPTLAGLVETAGVRWEDFSTREGGNLCDVLVDGPRRTVDVALVEAWLARGLATRLAGHPHDIRRRLLIELVPASDHLRALSPYDPFRMLGTFLDRDLVLEAFDALTDTIVRDARKLTTGRGSRLRGVIAQRIESLVTILPEDLRRPYVQRIREGGGDPSVPILLDAALGVRPEEAVPEAPIEPAAADEGDQARSATAQGLAPAPDLALPPASGASPAPSSAPAGVISRTRRARPPATESAGPAPSPVSDEDLVTIDGRSERVRGLPALGVLSAVTGLWLLRGLGRVLGRLLLGFRQRASVSASREGLRIRSRTWLLGRVVRDCTDSLGLASLASLRMDRRKRLFLVLTGLTAGALGSGYGVFVLLDGLREEYTFLIIVGVLLIGGGAALDLAGLWLAERLGDRAALSVRDAEGRGVRLTGLDPAAAHRFVSAVRRLRLGDERSG